MSITRLHTNQKLSRIVVHNDTVYLCGQVASDFSAGIAEQTRQTLAKIDELLAEVGSDKSKLLSVTVYVKDVALIDEMNTQWFAWLPEGQAPARTCVAADFGLPEILVEMTVTAAK